MILGRRVPVKPRVRCPETGAVVLLEDEILSLVERGRTGIVQIFGAPGSGKSTALVHLAAALLPDAPVLFFDDAPFVKVKKAAQDRLVVFTSSSTEARPAVPTYRLTPWGKDDLIEYLLAVHKDQCRNVMARVSAGDLTFLQGIPELWVVVLKVLAKNPTVPDARTALSLFCQNRFASERLLEMARKTSLELVIGGETNLAMIEGQYKQQGIATALVRLLRHFPMYLVLGAERLVADLKRKGWCDALTRRLPRELVKVVADSIVKDPSVVIQLQKLVAELTPGLAMAVSLLHVAKVPWVPRPGDSPILMGAFLDRVSWPGVCLAKANCFDTDLSRADLTGADLSEAYVNKADLRWTQFTGANLGKAELMEANLAHADLSSVKAAKSRFIGADLESAEFKEADLTEATFLKANLTSTSFLGADLSRAVFSGATIQDTDFSEANLDGAILATKPLFQAILTGARFRNAQMQQSSLEGVQLSGTDFENADLTGALLTSSTIPDANFTNACLRNTGLADISWERAILCNADLRGASFHLGSSRSGLVDSYIASEGSRTGFYTDDFDDQTFKTPEEIRKANLRGADLRGAKIEAVDFYLVDLRDALYDLEQERHLRRCGAILKSQAEEG